MRKIFSICLLLWCSFTLAHAQDTLPFPIDPKKKLSDARLAAKKEGWFLTGIPKAGFDPVQGFSIGGQGQLYNNRTKEDPFFGWTPYRERYDISFTLSQFGKVGVNIATDMPYFLNTKWRMRSRFAFSDNPNKLYFGPGTGSLEGLSYTDRQTGEAVTDAQYDDYRAGISVIRPGNPAWGEDPNQEYTDRRLNFIHYRKYALDIIAERTLLDGKLRLVTAVGFTHLSYTPYDFQTVQGARDLNGNEIEATNGVSQLTRDFQAKENGDPDSYWLRHNITGYTGGFSVKLKAGLIYDTRDFEPDPSKGTLLEYSAGYSAPWMGSDFNYVRQQAQWMQFITLPHFLPKRDNVLAMRLMLSGIAGQSVFFREVFDIWSATQGRIGVLGGEDTMRGFKKFRFAGMVYGTGNVELRSQLFGFSALKQDFMISLVPFVDFGRVWDRVWDVGVTGYKYSPGIGARIAWNQSTILRFDYSRSEEDSQFFFVFGHLF